MALRSFFKLIKCESQIIKMPLEDKIDTSNIERQEVEVIWLNSCTSWFECKELYKIVDNKLNLINYITFSFPIAITSIMLFSKQTNIDLIKNLYQYFELASIVGSLLILLFGLYSIIFSKNEIKKELYATSFRNNLQISELAKSMVEKSNFDDLDILRKFVRMQDQIDILNSPRIPKKITQEAFRYWLRESNQPCPTCRNSPLKKAPNLIERFFHKDQLCIECGAVILNFNNLDEK